MALPRVEHLLHHHPTHWPGYAARALVLPFILLLIPAAALAQRGVATVGLQVKPVVPLNYFDPVITAEQPHLRGTLELTGGLAFGMNVRVGITNTLSLETGIGQITRRYQFTMHNDTAGVPESDRVRYVGYEVPIMILAYVRLGERSWMNAALGPSMDFYPSDVQRDVEHGRVYMFRRHWTQMGVVGNMGVEYRTEKHGTFYLGATYHRPFTDMAMAKMTWYDRHRGLFPTDLPLTPLNGSYLTVDIRYYFHEDPNKVRLRRQHVR